MRRRTTASACARIKGGGDGEITEEREALRLNPNLADAHRGLGVALGEKGDWDGMIAEEREALRQDPNNVWAHVGLGAALERKGDRRHALEEYRELSARLRSLRR